MFENYTKDDIIEDLFHFTDALEDEGIINENEAEMLSELRHQWFELIKAGNKIS